MNAKNKQDKNVKKGRLSHAGPVAHSGKPDPEKTLAIINFSINKVGEAAFLSDKDGRFHFVNEESCRRLGYTCEELLALSVPDVDPDYSMHRWRRYWKELKAKGSVTFEGRHQRKDGSSFPVEISSNYFEYDNQGFNLALVRDITERKRAEDELRLVNRKLQAITTCNQTILRAADEESLLEEICGVMCREAGYSMAWVGYVEHDAARLFGPSRRPA